MELNCQKAVCPEQQAILQEWKTVPGAVVQPSGPPQEEVVVALLRGGWEVTEDRFIIDYILEKGKRWSDISRHLQN